MLWIETALVLFALLLSLMLPRLGFNFFARLEGYVSHVAERRALSVFLVGSLALSLRAVMLPLAPIPEPVVHDEFGYLLSADTFEHGRLTNPTHPLWEHFETFSEIQRPTYQCFAQPGQGMVLALGKIAFGHPFWGVWLSVGLMCAAITWMLQGWLPPRWALLGGFLAVLRFGVFGYWANSYWGGALGAIGGALVLGALPRIKRSLKIRDALLMGAGFFILANSRPYEGLVLCLPVAVAVFLWMCSESRPPLPVLSTRVLLPLTAMGLLTFASVGYYAWSVTGNPLRMPYQVDRETYAFAPYMLWQSPRTPPIYHHVVMQKMFIEEAFKKGYLGAFSPFTFVAKVFWAWSFFLGPALSLPLCMMAVVLPVGLRWRDLSESVRFLIVSFLICAAGLAAETFFHPHYASPMTGLVIALVLLAMRRVRAWTWHGRASGLLLARLLPLVCVVSFTLRAFAAPLHIPRYEFYAAPWYEWTVPTFGRQAIEDRVARMPGRQLVIVRYKPEHQVFFEWVYNQADIDHSKIVWAREMTPIEDAQLIDYFRDRQVWLLEADEQPPRLVPYTAPRTSVATAPTHIQDKPE